MRGRSLRGASSTVRAHLIAGGWASSPAVLVQNYDITVGFTELNRDEKRGGRAVGDARRAHHVGDHLVAREVGSAREHDPQDTPGPESTLELLPPDFLNSREDAMVIWGTVIIAFAPYKNFRGIGSSFLAFLGALFHPKMLAMFGSLAVYTGVLLYGANEAGLWGGEGSVIKAAVYWFLGTGVILAGEAVTRARPGDAYLLRKVFKRIVGVTILVEFIANAYALPLGYELVLVLVALAFTGMQVVARHDPSTPAPARQFIDAVLVAIAVAYLVYFLVRALGDLDGLLTRETAAEFLVGPVLTVAVTPFIYGLAWLSRREQDNLRKRFRSPSGSPA